MNNNKYRTQLYLEKDHYRFLKEQSARYQISMAEVVRRLLDRELEKMRKSRKKIPFSGWDGKALLPAVKTAR